MDLLSSVSQVVKFTYRLIISLLFCTLILNSSCSSGGGNTGTGTVAGRVAVDGGAALSNGTIEIVEEEGSITDIKEDGTYEIKSDLLPLEADNQLTLMVTGEINGEELITDTSFEAKGGEREYNIGLRIFPDSKELVIDNSVLDEVNDEKSASEKESSKKTDDFSDINTPDEQAKDNKPGSSKPKKTPTPVVTTAPTATPTPQPDIPDEPKATPTPAPDNGNEVTPTATPTPSETPGEKLGSFSMSGMLVDNSGEELSNVRVTIEQGNFSESSSSNSNGYFSFTDLDLIRAEGQRVALKFQDKDDNRAKLDITWLIEEEIEGYNRLLRIDTPTKDNTPEDVTALEPDFSVKYDFALMLDLKNSKRSEQVQIIAAKVGSNNFNEAKLEYLADKIGAKVADPSQFDTTPDEVKPTPKKTPQPSSTPAKPDVSSDIETPAPEPGVSSPESSETPTASPDITKTPTKKAQYNSDKPNTASK